MATHKVRAGSEYIYYPNLLDRCDGRTGLVPGSIVEVIHPFGCPAPNTMNHAHVAFEGQFIGMVHVNSLHSLKDRQLVIDAMKADVARMEAR